MNWLMVAIPFLLSLGLALLFVLPGPGGGKQTYDDTLVPPSMDQAGNWNASPANVKLGCNAVTIIGVGAGISLALAVVKLAMDLF